MRFFTVAILTMLMSYSFAKREALASEVWIDGSSFYKSVSHKTKSTIYFEKWDFYVQQFLEDKNYYVALQLDQRFDPLPEDDLSLPDLTLVAALANDSTLNQYFSFLENFGRTHGINYMILPESTGLSELEVEVIKKARQKSPFYFLNKTSLSREVPDSKSAFEEWMPQYPTIWLVGLSHNFKRVKRWASKYRKESQDSFVKGLGDAGNAEFIPTYGLPNSLRMNLVREGTIAIDPSALLPLAVGEVVYLGEDEALKKWLSRYAKVYETPVQGLQKIIDIRFEDKNFQEGDILITNRVVNFRYASQIVLPAHYEGLEIDLCKMLFGGVAIKGRHPLGRPVANHHFLTHSTSRWEGLDISYEDQIDSLSEYAISNFATPGLQVVIVKNGSLIFNKSYGYYSYDSIRKVRPNTIYDLASLTKVVATLPVVAYLIDQGKVNLDDTIGRYLPDFVGSNKSAITIKQLLAHQGGLKSYIPFWSMMPERDRLDAFYYKTVEDETLDRRSHSYKPVPILLDTLKSYIVRSKLIEDTDSYNYSDLGFMILHMIVEAVTMQPFDQFLERTFYQPMGLKNVVFNPLKRGINQKSVAPTEYDGRFRNYQIWGEVHDRNAAIFGGAAGHAGLFSNAVNLAKMMSMYMNGGIYGGKRYLSEDILNQFNSRYFDENRRGLGWDKKDGESDSASEYASDLSFGHTGFTGTMVWADPNEDLVFVFLSNRIYPDADNWRLNQLNIRKKMHDVVYESVIH